MENKKTKLSSFLDEHDYPPVFYRFPAIVRIFYMVNFVLTLRNWYVSRQLFKNLCKLSKGFTFLDAGSGMGEFSFCVAKRYPDSSVMGIDYLEKNEFLSRRMAEALSLRNVEFRKGDLTDLKMTGAFDLILCNSVLQFIKEDDLGLSKLYSSMKENGSLILYVPITYRRYLPWTEYLEKKFLSDFYYGYHKDFLMHKYAEREIIDKLRIAGYLIKSKEYTYGVSGAISFEIYSLVLTGIKVFPGVLSFFLMFIYIFCLMPVQILLMLADYLTPKSSGNGMLVVAVKN